MIKYHKQAEKFILSQGKTTALRLYRAIEKLPLGDVIGKYYDFRYKNHDFALIIVDLPLDWTYYNYV